MALRNGIGRRLFPWPVTGLRQPSFPLLFGSTLFVTPLKFAIISQRHWKMVKYLLHLNLHTTDLRVLYKPFALAAVHRERHGDTTLEKFESQSIPMIAIGCCPISNGLQFYNPANSTFVSSIDYTFQPHVTSGSRFGFKYQPGTFIPRLEESNSIFAPKFRLDSNVYVHMHSPPHLATVIGIPSYTNPDVYTVKFQDGTIAEYTESSNTLELAPELSGLQKSPSLLPDWVQGGCTATLFLHDMTKPNHGKLYEQSNGTWVFCTGNKFEPSKGKVLTDLSSNIQHLLDSGQLFKGHTSFLGFIRLVSNNNYGNVFCVMYLLMDLLH